MKTTILNLAFILAICSCTKEELIDIQDTSNLDAVIESDFKLFQMPGVAYAAIKGDSVVYMGAKGYANCEEKIPLETDTRMNIASVSKTVVATAIMQLYEEGLVELENDINDYLPFEVRNPHYPDTPITVHMLLTHTSSINDHTLHEMYLFGYVDHPESIMSFMESYLIEGGQYYSTQSFFDIKPGVEHHYSNYGTCLMACIVEHVSTMGFNQYCVENIFEPLGMSRTTWFHKDTPREELAIPYFDNSQRNPSEPFYSVPTYPDGGLMTSCEDLSRFLRAFIGNGTFENVKILDPETVDLMASVQYEDKWLRYGLIFENLERGGVEVWGHTGGNPGAAAEMFFDRETNTGYIIMINRTMFCKYPTIPNALLQYARGEF